MRKQSRSSCNPENEIEEMKKEAARLEQELSYQFRRWKELKTGTQKIVDPFYAEGSSMNMCRTQIIHIKEAIEANLSIDLYPDEYYEDTPEKYPLNYIANEETLIPRSKQRIAEVCAMLKEDGNTKKENDGFGLFNVNQRIQLHYGTEYGLKVQSTYGEETEVWVRIPVRTESSS